MLSNRSTESFSNPPVPGPQKSGRRAPTEKRRMQNRASQRKYREKIKDRLKSLEKFAGESLDRGNLQAPQAIVSGNYENYSGKNHDLDVGTHNASLTALSAGQLSHFEEEDDFNFPNNDIYSKLSESREYVTQALPFGEEGELNDLINGIVPWIENGIGEPSLDFSPELYGGFDLMHDMPDMSSPSTREMPTSTTREEIPEVSSKIFNLPESSDTVISRTVVNPFLVVRNRDFTDLRQMPTVTSSSSLQLYKEYGKAKKAPPRENPHLRSANRELASDIIEQLRLNDSKENQCLVRTAIARGYNVRDVLLSGLQTLGADTCPIPDPRKNTLTMIRTSTLNAYLHIAEGLGIHPPDLYNKQMVSPFYRSESTGAEGVGSPLASFTSTFPPHLQPTPGQIRHSHHPWIDLIPFPTLRDRALTLSSMNPPMVDLAELKNDVFMNNGLFNWRPAGKQATGLPWDMKTWEAEPWFLKKWWILVGGQNAEVWDHTNWWRGMRGEELVDSEWKD